MVLVIVIAHTSLQLQDVLKSENWGESKYNSTQSMVSAGILKTSYWFSLVILQTSVY